MADFDDLTSLDDILDIFTEKILSKTVTRKDLSEAAHAMRKLADNKIKEDFPSGLGLYVQPDEIKSHDVLLLQSVDIISRPEDTAQYCSAYISACRSPNIVITNVHKINLMLDRENAKIVPPAVKQLIDIFRLGSVTLDENQIDALLVAFSVPWTSGAFPYHYNPMYIVQPGNLGAFLLEHSGKKMFTLIW